MEKALVSLRQQGKWNIITCNTTGNWSSTSYSLELEKPVCVSLEDWLENYLDPARQELNHLDSDQVVSRYFPYQSFLFCEAI